MDRTDSPLHAVQGGGQDRAGADVGQSGAQLVDEVAATKCDDALDCRYRALTGSHRQGEELDDVGQLRLDP